MLLTALLKHPDAHLLRKLAGVDSSVRENCDSRITFELVRELEQEQGETEEYEETFAPDPALLAEISERLSYEYPHNSLSGVVAKRIASDFEDDGFDPTYFASETPGFINKTGLTPAQRGTATHRFMQYADYRRAVRDTEAELRRLVEEDILTPEEGEAVDVKSVHKFFVSSLADRILALPDDKIFKEYAFTVSLPLSEVYPDIPADTAKDEVIIIQGVADCAFIEDGELVIVDYKTDSASDVSELAVRYAPQLTAYRKCLEQAFGMRVKETLVYSFRFGTQIEIK
jgi:ATP-dependent helicase/nuclease subunit A